MWWRQEVEVKRPLGGVLELYVGHFLLIVWRWWCVVHHKVDQETWRELPSE